MSPAESKAVSRLRATDRAYYLSKQFGRLKPGCGTLQRFALDAHVLRAAVNHACISFSGNTLIVESPTGRFEQSLSAEELKAMFASLRRLSTRAEGPTVSLFDECFPLYLQAAMEAAFVCIRYMVPSPRLSKCTVQ